MAKSIRERVTAFEPERAGAFVGEVVEVRPDGEAQVRRMEGPRHGGPSALLVCRSAVPGYRPSVGDQVVVLAIDAGGEGPSACLVGVLGASPRVAAPSGASAEVSGDSILVRDAAGDIVADYDAARGTLRVGGGVDRLELGAPGGKLVLDADEIELKARSRASVASPELDVTAARASLHAEEVSVMADAIRSVAQEVAVAAGRWEVRVERIIERAGEVYREAELAETRAERVRTLARAAFDVIAGRASILADDDAVVDGKRVLLG